jgi:hypothetical protein
VVRGGEVLHSRGYGYADMESGRRFDSRTVFRTASVSKFFTAGRPRWAANPCTTTGGTRGGVILVWRIPVSGIAPHDGRNDSETDSAGAARRLISYEWAGITVSVCRGSPEPVVGGQHSRDSFNTSVGGPYLSQLRRLPQEL